MHQNSKRRFLPSVIFPGLFRQPLIFKGQELDCIVRRRASLAAPVLVHRRAFLPRGTEFTGHITQSDASGRLKGRAVLAVTLDSFRLNGKEYRVHTSSVERVSAAHKKRNLGFIGGGTGLGAALGAIAGGGKGALIGAAAGAAAGTAGAAATGKLEVGIGAESVLTFPLSAAVEL